MITGIPTHTELHQAGVDYLCLAWSDLISLLGDADYYADLEANVPKDEGEAELRLVEKHWDRELRRLGTCGALVHQGAEFLLKARIANVSPFLLLEAANGWPGSAAQSDTDFSEFKTVDSQLLPRIHDTVCPTRLEGQVKRRLEALRKRRNAVTHGIPSKLKLTAEELLKDILEVATVFVGVATWPQTRREYEHGAPATWSDYHGAIPSSLMQEWDQVLEFLTPAECKRYVGIDKKQRRYICPTCHAIDLVPEPPIQLAVLRPKSPQSCNLYCIVCGEDVPVVREECPHCDGNVLDDGRTQCLSCFEAVEEVGQVAAQVPEQVAAWPLRVVEQPAKEAAPKNAPKNASKKASKNAPKKAAKKA